VSSRVVSLWGSGTSRIYTLAKMKAAASGSAGKSFTSPWRMENFRPGNSRSVVLVIFIGGEYSIRSTRRSGGQEGKATTLAPHLPLSWGASRKTFNLHETGRTLVLGVRGGLEHVLNGLSDRRARARKQSNTLPDSSCGTVLALQHLYRNNHAAPRRAGGGDTPLFIEMGSPGHEVQGTTPRLSQRESGLKMRRSVAWESTRCLNMACQRTHPASRRW
jgi:hypothetical protein